MVSPGIASWSSRPRYSDSEACQQNLINPAPRPGPVHEISKLHFGYPTIPVHGLLCAHCHSFDLANLRPGYNVSSLAQDLLQQKHSFAPSSFLQHASTQPPKVGPALCTAHSRDEESTLEPHLLICQPVRLGQHPEQLFNLLSLLQPDHLTRPWPSLCTQPLLDAWALLGPRGRTKEIETRLYHIFHQPTNRHSGDCLCITALLAGGVDAERDSIRGPLR